MKLLLKEGDDAVFLVTENILQDVRAQVFIGKEGLVLAVIGHALANGEHGIIFFDKSRAVCLLAGLQDHSQHRFRGYFVFGYFQGLGEHLI